MKWIGWFFALVANVSAVEGVQPITDAPNWVPASKKEAYVTFVNACSALSEQAAEYAEALRSASKVDGCEVKDKGVIFKASRGKVKVEWYQEFEKVVKSCEYSGGTMTITFTGQDTEGSFMKALKYTAIIVGSVGFGILLGQGAR